MIDWLFFFRNVNQVAAAAPAVPYFGVYLRDLTLLEHGNANHLQFGRIHVAKVRRMIVQLQSIREFQGGLYDQILIVPEVCNVLLAGLAGGLVDFCCIDSKMPRYARSAVRRRHPRPSQGLPFFTAVIMDINKGSLSFIQDIRARSPSRHTSSFSRLSALIFDS